MKAEYTVILKMDRRNSRGYKLQEPTREELIRSLKTTLKEAFEFIRQEEFTK